MGVLHVGKRTAGLRPPRARTFALMVSIVAGLLYGSAALEFVWSRRDLLATVEREGLLASDWLARAGELSLESGQRQSALIDEGARSALRALEHTSESRGHPGGIKLPPDALSYPVAELRASDGAVLFQTSAPHAIPGELIEFLRVRPDLRASAGRLTANETPFLDRDHALIVEPGFDGTTWLAEIDDVHPYSGLSALIRGADHSGDILYFALQDAQGILAATANVRKLDRISQDSTLQGALTGRRTAVRQYVFEGHDVLEIARPFPMAGPAILRVGLSLDGLRRLQWKALVRVAISTGVLVIAGAILLGFVVSQERLAILDRAYTEIESRSRSILDNLSDGLLVLDRHGLVVQGNSAAARILGLHEVEGRTLEEIAGRIEGVDLTGPGTVRGRVGVRGAEVEVASSTLSSGRILLVRDVTELRRAERALGEAAKLTVLGRMASELAHEIRNPLNAISMSAQMLEREGACGPLPGTIRREIERLNRLVENFLRFRQVPDEPWAEVELGEVVREVTDLFAGDARARGVLLDCRIQSVRMRARRDRLKQAIVNIVKNALEAAPEGGRCAVLLSLDGHPTPRARLEIHDSGPGISPELRTKVFEPFVTMKPGGSGLGLSVAGLIIREHGGEIDVGESDLGGALFVIILPAQG